MNATRVSRALWTATLLCTWGCADSPSEVGSANPGLVGSNQCKADDDCPNSERCDTATRQCVGPCHQDDDCSARSGTGQCRIETGTCDYCTTTEDCKQAGLDDYVCKADNHVCAPLSPDPFQCKADHDCPNNDRCDPATGQCMGPCHQDDDCSARSGTGQCRIETGACDYCTTDEDCTRAGLHEHVCQADTHVCTSPSSDPPDVHRCKDDADCTRSARDTGKCDAAAGLCLHCDADADCDGTELGTVCDTSTARCR